MVSIPSVTRFDSTLALLRNPYGFISDTCRDLGSDIFTTRVLLEQTICMTGAAAAEVFYNEEQLVRAGSMPGRIRKNASRRRRCSGPRWRRASSPKADVHVSYVL